MLYQVDTGAGLIGMKYINADSEDEAIEKAKDILSEEKYLNCCGANDIYDGNLEPTAQEVQPDINLSDYALEPFYEQNVLRGYLLKKKATNESF